MTEIVEFTKMQGAGNDYIYFNCLEKELENPSEAALKLSDRHFGIGSDGIVMICSSETVDFKMRMFNADGSEAEMCGNAIRCVAKYVFDKGIWSDKTVKIESGGSVKTLSLNVTDGEVTSAQVDMGAPILKPEDVPVILEGAKIVAEPFDVAGNSMPLTCVSMGNPHAVFFVPEITDELVHGIGPQVEVSEIFPNRINAEFVKIINRSEIDMRVWERGAGETLACGTGACAAVVAAILNDLTDRKVAVHLLGGDLEIEWLESGSVLMTGPAEFVFEGKVNI